MLSAIQASLMEARDAVSDRKLDKATLRWNKIQAFLQTHDYIMDADVRELCDVSAATANRILGDLATNQKLEKIHMDGHWRYRLPQ